MHEIQGIEDLDEEGMAERLISNCSLLSYISEQFHAGAILRDHECQWILSAIGDTITFPLLEAFISIFMVEAILWRISLAELRSSCWHFVWTDDLFRSAKYLSIVELNYPRESPNLGAQLRKRVVFPLEEVILLDASENLESLSSSK